MTVFLIIAGIIAAITFLYALFLRPWLRQQPWMQWFYDWIDPIELALFKKSETVLMGRLLWLGSGIVTLYDAASVFFTSLDLKPLQTRVLDALHVPPDLRPLALGAFVTAIGLVIVNLRKKTTKPLELVAIPDDKITAETALALEQAEVAKQQAVAVVAEAKAS